MENIYTPYPQSTENSNNRKPKKEILDFLLNYSSALRILSSKKTGTIELLLN